VSFSAETLSRTLETCSERAAPAGRYIVAFSGGLDSSVLTHALVQGRARGDVPVVAVHIDHGLQSASAEWNAHCKTFATALGIEYAGVAVRVDLQSGKGTEAAARDARYTAFRGLLEPGDWLLSAHHRDDQAETVLLNLMRGSGPAGLAGIRRVRRFSSGWLVRPLLDVPRGDLEEYADKYSLDCIADPSNLDQQFDRNYLRHDVLPRFAARWPDAANRIRQTARLSEEASDLLRALAEIDATELGGRYERLPIAGLARLDPARQRNVLRHVIAELGLAMPGSRHLEQILNELVLAREDAQPLVTWPGTSARRHRDHLYLMPADEPRGSPDSGGKFSASTLELGHGLGKLKLRPGAETGLSDATVERGLELRYRVGGEEIKPAGQRHTRKLKKLLQEENVVPWMRERLPLLYSGDRLVAVADLWIADDAASRPGTAIEWLNRPAID
jgi:tRNA(Ile)-lysidine synthase